MYSHYQVCFHKNKKSDEIMLPDDKKISKIGLDSVELLCKHNVWEKALLSISSKQYYIMIYT